MKMNYKNIAIISGLLLSLNGSLYASSGADFEETISSLQNSNAILTKAVVKLIKKEKMLEQKILERQGSRYTSPSTSSSKEISELKAKIRKLQQEVKNIKYNVSQNTKEIAKFVEEGNKVIIHQEDQHLLQSGYKNPSNGYILPDESTPPVVKTQPVIVAQPATATNIVKNDYQTDYEAVSDSDIPANAIIIPEDSTEYEILSVEPSHKSAKKKRHHKKRKHVSKKRTHKKTKTLSDDEICQIYDCSNGYLLDGKFIEGPKPE